MNWKRLRPLAALAALFEVGAVNAAGMNLRVFEINDHLLSFYGGRPPEAGTPRDTHNWADFGAMNVGVATYVSGDLITV